MLSKLQHIVQQVNEAASLDEALAIIVSRVKEAMGADVCFVFLKDAPPATMSLRHLKVCIPGL